MALDDPRFYYLPDGANLTRVTLDECLTELQVQPVTYGDAATSASGSVSAVTYGHAWRVRILLERFRDDADTRRRKLQALINHLQRGGYVGFSADHSRAWGANCSSAPGNGDTTVSVGANDFSSYSASGAVTAGDNIILQSPNPSGLVEMIRLASFTGAGAPYTMGLLGGTQVELDHVATTFARWEWFWPRLRLDPDARLANLLTSERQWVYTLDLPLVTDPVAEHGAI